MRKTEGERGKRLQAKNAATGFVWSESQHATLKRRAMLFDCCSMLDQNMEACNCTAETETNSEVTTNFQQPDPTTASVTIGLGNSNHAAATPSYISAPSSATAQTQALSLNLLGSLNIFNTKPRPPKEASLLRDKNANVRLQRQTESTDFPNHHLKQTARPAMHPKI